MAKLPIKQTMFFEYDARKFTLDFAWQRLQLFRDQKMTPSSSQSGDIPEIRLSELLGALSHALDMVEGQPAGHCVRSCWIGIHVGREIGLDDKQIWELYYTLLLKDLGCSSNAARICRLFLTDDLTFKHDAKTIDGSLPQALRFCTLSYRSEGRTYGPISHVNQCVSKQWSDWSGIGGNSLSSRRGYCPENAFLGAGRAWNSKSRRALGWRRYATRFAWNCDPSLLAHCAYGAGCRCLPDCKWY